MTYSLVKRLMYDPNILFVRQAVQFDFPFDYPQHTPVTNCMPLFNTKSCAQFYNNPNWKI